MPNPPSTTLTRRLSSIDRFLQTHYIEPGRLVGTQLLVAHHGEVIHRCEIGLRDRERQQPLTPDTIFRIFSMTKPVTSVALMQLHEQGLFQLNEPVARVLPELSRMRVWVSGRGEEMVTRPPARPITFRHLLSHTAGLTYGGILDVPGVPAHPVDECYRAERVYRDGTDDLEAFVGKVGRMPLRYDPGSAWLYSLATDVIGLVVQRLSGMPFPAYLQAHILGPLAMKDTAFTIAPDRTSRFAANYQFQPDAPAKLIDDPEASRYAREPALPSGGGGLVGTADDYLRFCEMLRRGGTLDGARILGPRSVELMARNHLPDGQDLGQCALDAFSETAQAGVGFGLGLATTLDAASAGTFGEGDRYWGGLASTLFWVDPAEALSVVFMTQLIPSATYPLRAQLKSLIYSALD